MGHKVKITRKSRYAPIRYEATRPYAGRLGKLFVSEARKGETRRINFVMKELLPLVIDSVTRLGKPDGPGPGQGELVSIQVYGGYQEAGRVVFDVRKELAASLLVTDSHDIPCEAITFPYRVFYLHFGHETGLTENGMAIEGAFVHLNDNPRTMHIDLVPVGTFSYSEFWLLPLGEQLTGVRIDMERPTESIMDALDRSIDDALKHNAEIFEQAVEMERRLTIQYGQPVSVPSPVENLADKRDLLRRCVQLVVNTLFFLNAAPDDVEEDWEESAPADVIAQTYSEKSGTKKTAENSLANQGYVKVKFVGRHYAQSSASREVIEALSSGRTISTHLRRGHFRRQPYGPERSLRTTVFIAPIVVNAGKGEPAGRIYEARHQ